MKSYVAIPEEKLAEIGKPCTSLFVLQRGRAKSLDDKGSTEVVAAGSVIGHMATSVEAGKMTRGLEVLIGYAKNLKSIHGDPYVLIKCGRKACRSRVKKTKKWGEKRFMKILEGETVVEVQVKGWNKDEAHGSYGMAKINLGGLELQKKGASKSELECNRGNGVNSERGNRIERTLTKESNFSDVEQEEIVVKAMSKKSEKNVSVRQKSASFLSMDSLKGSGKGGNNGDKINKSLTLKDYDITNERGEKCGTIFLQVSERSELALMKTRIRATTKLTLFSIFWLDSP